MPLSGPVAPSGCHGAAPARQTRVIGGNRHERNSQISAGSATPQAHPHNDGPTPFNSRTINRRSQVAAVLITTRGAHGILLRQRMLQDRPDPFITSQTTSACCANSVAIRPVRPETNTTVI
jgi:hypothetical protein